MVEQRDWELQDDPPHIHAKKLKNHLFEAYGGFADKRIKNLDKRSHFIVDDREVGPAFGANKQLYPWFCTITAKVMDPTTIRVVLAGAPPMSDDIRDWMGNNADKDHESERGPRIIVTIQLGSEEKLRDLANLMRSIVRPGNRYPIAAYKYVCPRTASSLDRLADILESAPRE